MRAPFCVLAAAMLVLVLALGACGESSEDKAQTAVCDARADIRKQVDTLTSLTAATVTTDAVKQSLDAIKKDLSDISSAQADLSGDRRSEVEAATKAFTSSVKGITSELLTSISASDAKSALVTALQQLKTSYESAFEPVDCS
jgi:Tfp pilus assembly protein PilP